MTDYQSHSSIGSYLIGGALLCGTFALFASSVAVFGLPEVAPQASLITLGAIAMWRYVWLGIHLARASIYQRVVFPNRRASLPSGATASHIYVVVLSYRMGIEINAAVYGALIRDLRRYGCPATIVACITDTADIEVLDALGDLGKVRIMHLRQSDKGKRDAMERGLALLAQSNPPPGSVVALVDGDTLVPEGTFERIVPLLIADTALGALTTDNIPLVAGSALAREWYRLRMLDRHQLLSSVSLSERLLVLTGRFSLFRAEIALSPGFISAVGHDAFYHWRFGRVAMLTGDDKSTWYWVLRSGWKMIYVPDVAVYCLERLPREGFFESTTALMRRYFGNMARNNARAIGLGPRRIGYFTWLALIDQRISPWTTLLGPASVLALTLAQHKSFLAAYLCWVLLTRTAQSAAYGIFRPAFHPLFPFLKFYNQIVGGALKVSAFFNPDRQSWTRQHTGNAATLYRASSTSLMWLSVLLLVLAAITASSL